MPNIKKTVRDFRAFKITWREAALLLGKSKSAFFRLIESGVIPRSDDGDYILGEVLDGYYNSKIDDSGLIEAQTRLINANAEIKELKLAEMKGQTFRASDVSRAWTDNVINAKTRILAIPAKISQELEGKEAPVISQILKREIYEALNELAEYDDEKF